MQVGEQGRPPLAPPATSVVPLFKKVIPEDLPVTAQSKALFRFGEQCNYKCPMCSNTGEPALFFRDTEELLRRADFLRDAGFRSVVVTGGEATIHPGFWSVIDRLAAGSMRWDTNTHGRTFSKPGFAARGVDLGLQRAIVSLHSFAPATSAAIFGTSQASHHGTVEGIERLLEAGVEVMLNCVISRLNLSQLGDYLCTGAQRFGSTVSFKFVFPSTIGKGGRWDGIAGLRYADLRDPLLQVRSLAAQRGLRVAFESFPNCVLDDREGVNFGRSTFGETHYLDDATGDRVYAMRHIEAELSAFGEACRECPALARCPGVALAYAQQHGVGELSPFPNHL